MSETHTNVLIRITTDLKAALQREAHLHDRKLTQEINIRLRDSLKLSAPGLAPAPLNPQPLNTLHDEPAYLGKGNKLHPSESAMLTVFRAMPPEKQLALLSLFR